MLLGFELVWGLRLLGNNDVSDADVVEVVGSVNLILRFRSRWTCSPVTTTLARLITRLAILFLPSRNLAI